MTPYLKPCSFAWAVSLFLYQTLSAEPFLTPVFVGLGMTYVEEERQEEAVEDPDQEPEYAPIVLEETKPVEPIAIVPQERPAVEPLCTHVPKSLRAMGSHIQGDGIGYKDGYTSLGFFAASPYLLADHFLPFADVKAHLLNDGMPAATAGVGLRYVGNRIWGINTYYDYRKSHHMGYNQVSLGLESLGKIWDFRLNGYLPVGSKRTELYDEQFSHVDGTTLFFSKKYEFDFKGANAEMGVHFKRNNYIPLYFALGPYYLSGQAHSSWGGSMRLACDLGRYFRVEGLTSYDSLFGWRGQGFISLSVGFGVKKQPGCEKQKLILTRAVQTVDRHEIIPLKTAKVIYVGD